MLSLFLTVELSGSRILVICIIRNIKCRAPPRGPTVSRMIDMNVLTNSTRNCVRQLVAKVCCSASPSCHQGKTHHVKLCQHHNKVKAERLVCAAKCTSETRKYLALAN